MDRIKWAGIKWAGIKCVALTWLALLADNAFALKTMEEKEQTQTIVWIVEGAAFITIIVVFGFVWRLATRETNKRKSGQKG